MDAQEQQGVVETRRGVWINTQTQTLLRHYVTIVSLSF